MLNKKDLKDLISATRQHIALQEAFIEKDYHVTRVIHALSNVENEYFRLVFAGGTCLAKGHKLVKRMSEDVDFKIQSKQTDKNFSNTRFFKELKQFRSQIMSALEFLDLKIGETAARNNGKYSRIELHYPSSFSTQTILRPHILLEFTLSDIRLATENLFIKTLIENTLKIPALFEPTSTHCISIDETAIEKWVGLTRRVMAIERQYHYDDPTLVRHVYDLNAIKHADKINDNFFKLAKTIINYDAQQFKTQHPEYSADPSFEIQKSLDTLKNKSSWKTRYQEFIETMVYDDISVQDYNNAIQTLEKISKTVIDALK
ncbi:MAG: nucleotidyl transferase AbiEii/AbiGii toxin family protein [Gammaproteobacteria bacterium]|nr:MAG: nucleotidyl transferase AbiEii/AbiGii toxin family protein [Gammaproteobacteria bacterium]